MYLSPLRQRTWSALLPIVLLSVLLAATSPKALAEDIEVLVGPSWSAPPPDRQVLRAVFTMRIRTWPDGRPIRVFVLPDDHEVHGIFCREQLGTYPYVLRNAWDRMVFTGTGLAPQTVRDEEEMRTRVRNTPGAIGYVRVARPSQAPTPSTSLARLRPGDR